LGPDEVLVERTEKEGWAVASDDGVTVALDTTLDDELLRQARVHELVHRVNTMRRESGLALTDRIALTLPSSDRDLLDHRDWIATETLATSVDVSPDDELALTRTAPA
jgi:isoleucyl-tRNA synthetase